MDEGLRSLIATMLVGFVVVFVGIVMLIRTFVRLRGWKKVTGIVVAAHKTYDSSYDTWYYAPVAEYVPAGSSARLRVTGDIRSSLQSSIRVGGRVSVVYDPAQPENAKIATLGQLYLGPLLFTLVGIFIAGIAVVYDMLS